MFAQAQAVRPLLYVGDISIMKLYTELQRALPYDVVPITEDNYDTVREVFDTNLEFLVEGYGKLVEEKGVLGAIAQLPDGFNPADKYLAAICQKGKAIAAVDLLGNSPTKNELWLSFLVVHEDLKSSGLGAQITEGVVCAAQMAGFTKINLGSFETTAAFWEKQGFTQSGANDNFLTFYRSLQ